MRTEIKDYFFSAIAILLIFTATIFFIKLLKPWSDTFLRTGSVIAYILLFFPLYGLLTTLYLHTLNKIFSFKEGTYDMTHFQFLLWKHYAVVEEFGKIALRPFFPIFMRPQFYKILGSKMGKNVAIGGVITDPCLTTIEDYAVIGQDSVITSHTMLFNKFIIKPVIINKGATIGINAVIMPGVEIGEYSVIAPGAVVLMNTKVPPREFWGGIPAKRIRDIYPVDVPNQKK